MMPLPMTPPSIHHVVDPRFLSYVLPREVGESKPFGAYQAVLTDDAFVYDSLFDPPRGRPSVLELCATP